MEYALVIARLESLSDPKAVEGMARVGITAEKVYGISIPNLRNMAREIGRDHELALKLWVILLPLNRIIIVWIGAYSLIVSILFALIAQWLEVRGTRAGRDTGLGQYAIAAAVIALPMAFHFAPPGVRLLSLLSPLSGMIRLYAGASAAELAVLFAIPPVGSLIALLLIRRESRWSRVRV